MTDFNKEVEESLNKLLDLYTSSVERGDIRRLEFLIALSELVKLHERYVIDTYKRTITRMMAERGIKK